MFVCCDCVHNGEVRIQHMHVALTGAWVMECGSFLGLPSKKKMYFSSLLGNGNFWNFSIPEMEYCTHISISVWSEQMFLISSHLPNTYCIWVAVVAASALRLRHFSLQPLPPAPRGKSWDVPGPAVRSNPSSQPQVLPFQVCRRLSDQMPKATSAGSSQHVAAVLWAPLRCLSSSPFVWGWS